MNADREAAWLRAEKWVRIYSYITWVAVAYGIVAAHLPFIIGHPWSSCEVCGSQLYCVLTFHLYEVPLVLFNAFIAWYGLGRYSRAKAPSYMSLLNFAVMGNLTFFTFEIKLLLESLCRQAPTWELLALASISIILIAGAGLGVFVKQMLVAVSTNDHQS